jgi:hypothetical protein
VPWQELKAKPPELIHHLRLAALINGVDITGWPGAMASAALSEADLAGTLDALRAAIGLVTRQGAFAA